MNVNHWMLWPPVAFAAVLLFVLLLLRALSAVAWRGRPGRAPGGQGKAYACGEDMKENRVQPDYSQFFPFAFFFTLVHVAVLVVATAPEKTLYTELVDLLYLLCAIVGVSVLLRKET